MNENLESLNDLIEIIKRDISLNQKLKYMDNILINYVGKDYMNYVNFDDNNYKRNLVYKDDFFDVYIICWNNNQKSEIHDHPENGCLLKILEGELIEKRYVKRDNKMIKIGRNFLKNSNISYMEGKKVLHCIKNGDSKTISLHIYSPPNYKPKKFKKN